MPARSRAELPELEPLFARIEHHLGVLPNSTLTMAHRPAIAEAFAALNQAVAAIGVFGFLNRWNDTVATTLESSPLAFARDHLTDGGWHVGKHAGGDA